MDHARAAALNVKACDGGVAGGCYLAALDQDTSGNAPVAARLYAKACDIPGKGSTAEERDGMARSCIEAGHARDRANDIDGAAKRFKRACDLGYSGPLIKCPF